MRTQPRASPGQSHTSTTTERFLERGTTRKKKKEKNCEEKGTTERQKKVKPVVRNRRFETTCRGRKGGLSNEETREAVSEKKKMGTETGLADPQEETERASQLRRGQTLGDDQPGNQESGMTDRGPYKGMSPAAKLPRLWGGDFNGLNAGSRGKEKLNADEPWRSTYPTAPEKAQLAMGIQRGRRQKRSHRRQGYIGERSIRRNKVSWRSTSSKGETEKQRGPS